MQETVQLLNLSELSIFHLNRICDPNLWILREITSKPNLLSFFFNKSCNFRLTIRESLHYRTLSYVARWLNQQQWRYCRCKWKYALCENAVHEELMPRSKIVPGARIQLWPIFFKCTEIQREDLISSINWSFSHDLTHLTPICCNSPIRFPSALRKLHTLNER